jgi:hypothetical protein
MMNDVNWLKALPRDAFDLAVVVERLLGAQGVLTQFKVQYTKRSASTLWIHAGLLKSQKISKALQSKKRSPAPPKFSAACL